MKSISSKSLPYLTTVILLFLCLKNSSAAINASYLYSFSDFNGRIDYTWPLMSIDQEHGEIYVVSQGYVSVFNSVGMEIYRFGDDQSLGNISDVAIEKDGNILVISSKWDYSSGGYIASVLRCNYRGEQKETVVLKGLPQEFSMFLPNRLVYWKGNIYFADIAARKIVVTDSGGSFVDGYNVGAILASEEKPGTENFIGGFNVDKDGNMLLTVPTLFLALKISRDHKVESFGSPGSLDGKFNVVGGIASDDRGYIYVADILKSVIMVYDKDFKFQMQFGYRGSERGSLVAPQQVEIMSDKLFVNQARNRGISVFRINY